MYLSNKESIDKNKCLYFDAEILDIWNQDHNMA